MAHFSTIAYTLRTITDPERTQHGWTCEILVFMDDEEVTAKAYKSLTEARKDLIVRSDKARRNLGDRTLTVTDETQDIGDPASDFADAIADLLGVDDLDDIADDLRSDAEGFFSDGEQD